MSDEDALLAAIIANPDEDTPRLVYADWLQENGQAERAEFIRVQIELTRAHATKRRSARRIALLKRLRELLEKHADRWRIEFWLPSTQTIFRRGFVEEVEVTPMELTRIMPEALLRHPIRSLWINERSVTFTEGRSAQVFRSVSAWPGLSRLQTLRASRLEITASAIAALTATTEIANLRVLDLSDCWVDDGSVAALADSKNLEHLEELRFSLVPLRSPGALSLACSSCLKKLRCLRILCGIPSDLALDDPLHIAIEELKSRFGNEVRVFQN